MDDSMYLRSVELNIKTSKLVYISKQLRINHAYWLKKNSLISL